VALFEKALEASVMSTHLLIRANVSKSILLQAHKIATDFESRYSAYKEDSFLNTINANAGKQPTSCTLEDIALFNTCIEASKHTLGAFDITIGSLSHATYHYGFANETMVSDKQIQEQKKLIDYKNIILKKQSITLEKKGMRLDLGGIGKGYVAKMIAQFLVKSGATKLLVDVGGEIVTRGKSYTIGLKNPFKEGNLGYIKTSKEDLSISTSGDYIRFLDSYNHHILDSKEGKSRNYYSSMTIIQNGWDIDLLDAYATACFNQTPQELNIIQKKLHISMVVIDKDAIVSLYNLENLKLDTIHFIP